MTLLEKHTKKNQLMIRICELENLISERDKETAAKIFAANEKLRKLTEQYNKQLEELSKKEAELKQILAEYKQNEVYRDAGQRFLIDLKTKIRTLAIQCGETVTEEDDAFLSKQLSFCGPEPAEVAYLQQMKRKLQERRSKMFLLESLNLDPIDSEHEKKEQYRLGKKIGKPTTIPIH